MQYLLALLITLLCFVTNSWAAMPNVALKDHAAAFATTASPADENYNFKWGNVRTDVIGNASLEYNDNINQTTTGKIKDTILRLGVQTRSIWPVTELNAITLDLNAGYRVYFENPALNSSKNFLDINPGSELAFKWWIRNWEFKLYDQLSYTVNAADTRIFNTATTTVTPGNISLGVLNNRAGLEALWDLNDLKVYSGYSRDDVRADQSSFRSLDRTAHTVYLSPLFLINPEFSVGILSSYTWNDYRANFQNDSKSWALGPTFFWQATANTSAALNVYWKGISSENDGTNGDTSDTRTLNGSFNLTQEINSFFSHSFELGRNTDFGTVTNATTINSAYYLPIYQLNESLSLKGRLGYEDGKDSNGANREDYIRRVYGIGAGYTVNQKLKTELAYNHVVQSSNIPERPFNQNQVVWTVNYDF